MPKKQLFVEEPFHILLLHHKPCNVNSTALFTLHNTCKRLGTAPRRNDTLYNGRHAQNVVALTDC